MKLQNLNWNCRRLLALGAWLALAATNPTLATERAFTFTYEPETMPEGATEVEQWVSLAAGRRDLVGGVNDKKNYHRWEFRTELEYGVSDIYQVSLYLNAQHESFRDAGGMNLAQTEFKGVSLENIVNLFNPANHCVGVSLYLEPSYAGETAEIEQKIILGQRHGDWKWALNLNHAVEWENSLHDLEGEFGAAFGLTRFIGKHWAVGLEARNVNRSPRYSYLESSSIHVGPVVSFRQEKWWATLTVMPQVFGRNWKDGADDRSRNLDLIHNERVSVRLILGFDL